MARRCALRISDVKPMHCKIVLNRMKTTYAGLRTSEMIGLTWDSIDWKKRTLTVSKTLEYRHNTKVWRAGPPKTKSSYRTIPLTARAYDVRHPYATRAIESGVMPKVLQKLLGHSSIKTTMDRYVHVTDDSLNNAIKLFEQNTILAG